MDPTIQINERVDLIATFKAKGDHLKLCSPCRMRWRGQDILLDELALKYPTEKGKRMIHIFHVSDGSNNYRLEFDAEALTWTLLSLLPGDYFEGGTS